MDRNSYGRSLRLRFGEPKNKCSKKECPFRHPLQLMRDGWSHKFERLRCYSKYLYSTTATFLRKASIQELHSHVISCEYAIHGLPIGHDRTTQS